MTSARWLLDALHSGVAIDRQISTADPFKDTRGPRRRIADHPASTAQTLARFRDLASVNDAPQLAARSLYLQAQAVGAAGDLAGSLTLIERAAEEFNRLGMAGAALRTNLGLTYVLNETGRHAEALNACELILRTLATNPPSDLDPEEALELRAFAEQNRGLCFELTSQWDRALEAYANAEASYVRLDDEESIGEVLSNRGQVLLATGRVSEAHGVFTEAIALLRARGRSANVDRRDERAEPNASDSWRIRPLPRHHR